MCPGLWTSTGLIPILYNSEANSTDPSTQFACCDAMLWSMNRTAWLLNVAGGEAADG